MSDLLCYVDCNNCSTILATDREPDTQVNVPYGSLFKIVTVRCGHCAQLLSVDMGTSLHPQPTLQPNQNTKVSYGYGEDSASSSTISSEQETNTANERSRTACGKTPDKRSQRIPSAYNRFIKEEIQRIKASNPHIRHREAFSAAAKNWAHFPARTFGLVVENNIMSTPNIDKEDSGEVFVEEALFERRNDR